jgi:hypothetical protein
LSTSEYWSVMARLRARTMCLRAVWMDMSMLRNEVCKEKHLHNQIRCVHHVLNSQTLDTAFVQSNDCMSTQIKS